jgi:hypothetical protein
MNSPTTVTGNSAACWWSSVPLAWIILILVDVSLVALACAQENRPQPEPVVQLDEGEVVQIDGDPQIPADAVRFEAIDVFVDSGQLPLAAYQFELISETAGVEIVGIEGGEHAAFSTPPYYDPQAMNNNRVILAAFSTDNALPTGRSRVARIHLQVTGPAVKEYRTWLRTTADADGQQIPARVSIARTRA